MLAGINLKTILGGLLLLALLSVVWNNMGSGSGFSYGSGSDGAEAEAGGEEVAHELDGVLGAGVGEYHKVEHNNKFVCTDCNTCAPAQYSNDVEARSCNLETVRRIRAMRGDPYPTGKL